jgi:hypothetical protein
MDPLRSLTTPRLPACRAGLRLLVCLTLVAAAAFDGGPARAASTGSTNLLMPQGTAAEVQFGDYITSSVASACGGCPAGAGIDKIYRYFIEVPAGLSHLRIQVFDADVGAPPGGGTAESDAQRDRSRTGTFHTNAVYTLLRPDGTTAVTQTCTAATASAFCVDNTWTSLLDTTTTPIQAGHWELDVDQTTAVNGASAVDINAFGIRADDGDATSGGTEIPVYYSAHNQIGQNPPSSGTAGTKTYTFYPWITSGCSFAENDFDFDNGNGGAGQNVGSIDFTSRSGSFTKNFAAASLSTNDNWNSNSVSGYTTDSDSVDYGIWTMQPAISNYTVSGVLQGNYANVYVANSSAAAPPPGDNAPTANTFRVYFAADGGAAPLKPYMKQEARYVGNGGGPNPPVVGMTTIIVVTVQVVNPTAKAITFSASNLVTTNVPGSGATYGGNDQETQGGPLVSHPAIGGTGNITWNPGTVAAGATALLAYQVNVKPTSAGQRIPVVGTVASGNGTTGKWVDETGNTTQTRATYTFGPLCELAATQGVASAAEVVELHATASGHGAVVEWQTAAEISAAGFDLYREEPATRGWRKVNRTLVPALPGSPQGGTYRVVDADAPAAPEGGALRYIVVETETSGASRRYPFQVMLEPARTAELGVDGSGAAAEPAVAVERSAHRDPAWQERLAAAAAEVRSRPASAEPAAAGGPPSLAIGVRKDGLYRVDPSLIGPIFSGPGKPGSPKSANYQLTSQGLPVAWTLDAAGGLLFYGQASTSIYALDNVYWLRPGPGVRMGTTSGGAPTTTGSATASFTDTAHSEQENFAATTVPADPDSDYWYWDFLIAGDPTYGVKSFAVAAPNVNAGGGAVTVQLKGAIDAQHHVQVKLNGALLGDTTWSGAVDHSATFVASGFDASGTNTVEITALLDPGVSASIAYVQSIDATFERSFTAVGDALAFRGSGNSLVTVSGFSGPAIRVLDLTNPRLPALVTGARIDTAGSAASLTLQPSTPATPYYAAGPTAVHSPPWARRVTASGLSQRPGGADYLILTTADLVPAASVLAGLRAAQGLRTAVVDVADVMNEFNYGLSSPHAIEAFLRYVKAAWNPVPRYVVLAGAGNFDYRNVLGLGGNLVPPRMVSTDSGIFAADNRFAEVNGDGVPAFAVGRLPVVSSSELLAYVAKLAAYEATPGAGWINRALMLADEVGPNDGLTDFAADSVAVTAGLPPGYAPQQIVVTPGGVNAARSALFAGLGAGAGLVNFFGHAGLDRLSPEGLLTTTDAAALANGPRLPLMAALTCSVNRFDVPGFSPLGEVLANQPRGGVIAIWSSSGLSVHPEAKALAQTFYLALANPANLRLGDATQEAFRRYAATPGTPVTSATLDLYTLLGDPAILLKPVPVAPPGSTTSPGE